jgi:hypothetical protein
VEEHAPCAEVAALDHPAQLRVVLDPHERHLRGRVKQPFHQAVRLGLRHGQRLDRQRPAKAQLVLDLGNAEAGRQVEQREALPLHGAVRQCHQHVLVRRGQGLDRD